MISWRKAVEEYVELRRSLGFKLLEAKVGLLHFALFLERRRASHITIALALEWAQQDKTARPAEWATAPRSSCSPGPDLRLPTPAPRSAR